MKQANNTKVLTNVYISDIDVNDFIKKLNYFKITNILSKPDNKDILNLLFSMGRKFNGIFSYIWKKNIIIGICKNAVLNENYVMGKYTLELISKPNITAISDSNISDLISKYYKNKLYKKLIIDGDYFYSKNLTEQENILKLNGFQIRNKILDNGKIIISIDHKFKALKKVTNATEVAVMKGNKNFITLFDGLSKRFIYITDVTNTKAKDCTFGEERTNLIDYITQKYNFINPKDIDIEQNVVKAGEYTYIPQFLYSPVNNKNTQIRMTEDVYHRFNEIKKQINVFDLIHIKFDDFTINFRSFDITNNYIHLSRPKRKYLKSDGRMLTSLANGFLYKYSLDDIFIYSDLDKNNTRNIYKTLIDYSKKRYDFELPENYIPLDHELQNVKKDILNAGNNIGIIAISDNDNIYKDINELIENQKLTFKMMRLNTAQKILKNNSGAIIGNFLISFLLRAGNIPWLLEKLNYNNYTFLDVGRGNANYIGYSFLENNNGKFIVEHSLPIKGEHLSYNDLRTIFNKLPRNDNTLFYVRDGNISNEEYESIFKILKEHKFESIALIEYKKTEPYRIFRSFEKKIFKPQSGDCIKLDKNNYIIVNTGSDEYNSSLGTPSTKLITFKDVKGDVNKIGILNDLHSLCYLNWSTPISVFSDPAPLHYIDNLLNDYGKGIIREFIPY